MVTDVTYAPHGIKVIDKKNVLLWIMHQETFWTTALCAKTVLWKRPIGEQQKVTVNE